MGDIYNQNPESRATLSDEMTGTENKEFSTPGNEVGESENKVKDLISAFKSDYYFLEKVDSDQQYKVVRLIKNNEESKVVDELKALSLQKLFPQKIVNIIINKNRFIGAKLECTDNPNEECYVGRGCYNVIITGPTTVLVNHLRYAETESVLAELIDSHKNLKRLQDNVQVGLFRIRENGDFVWANPWTMKVLGFKQNHSIEKENIFKLFIDPDQQKQFKSILESEGAVQDMEINLRKSKDDNVWCVASLSRSQTANRQVVFEGYLYGITKRKAIIEQLRENDGIFQAISQNLKSTLYLFNENGQFTYVNASFAESTGYSEQKLLQMKIYDIVHPEFKDKVKEYGFNSIVGKEAPRNYEFIIITKHGEERWMEIYATRHVMQGEWAVISLGRDITSRKKVLEEIKTSEEKYKSLYSFFRLMADNTQDMIWAKDLEKRYIFANKALCETLLLADDTEEPVGKTDQYFADKARQKLPHENDWYTFGDQNDDTDDIVMATRQTQQFDEYGNVNGEFLYLDVNKSPLFDDSGRMIGTVGSARNVTFAKQMEAEREKEEKIKNIVYRIGNAVSTTKDLSELITVIRLELSEVVNTTNMYIALYDKKNREISLPYFVDERDRFKRIPAGKSLTYYLIRKNTPLLLREKDILELFRKNEIELLGSMAKVWLGIPLIVKDNTIGAIVIQNYTDENALTEKDLELLNFVSIQISISINQKQADDALRESEFTLRQIIDNVPVMIYAKDKDLRLILANKAFAAAYGKRVDEVEGQLQSDLHSDSFENKKHLGDDLEVIQKGQAKTIGEELFTDHNGVTRILQTIKLPIKQGNDQGIAMLGVSIDITERITFEEELKLAKNKAEEVDRLKTAFLANMSHEIRTPMNAIIGFSELLNDPELSSQNRSDFVKLIGENSRIMLTLIEDIIDIAKIEAGQIKVARGACQINLVLDELKKYSAELISKEPHKEIDIKVKCEVDDPRFAISTDPLRFKQVLKKLIGNAIKFTDHGHIEIGYEIEEKNRKIIFYVKDTGIGLEDDKLSLIFERFRQAEESSTKEYGGTGLGLTISRRLIEIMGGSMWVESIKGQGSTFYFSLPYEVVNVEGFVKPFTHQSDKHDWSGKLILVAEDETSNFELISATLDKTNTKILRAFNGREALDIVEANNKIDLILMDIRMPVMNGHEATREIRKLNSHIPIISLTAYAMSDDIQKSLDVGCTAHISKPFKPSELLNKLQVYM